MPIEEYFTYIRKTIEDYAIIQTSNITYDKRGTYEGFIRGEIYFVDNSVLYLREFIDVEAKIERLMYVYHYMDSSQKLVFRYDNTGHHKKLNLSTYPHHKHLGSEENVVTSDAPDLDAVLSEIESMNPYI